MIYTLKRKTWLYPYNLGEEAPPFWGKTREADRGDRFRLVGHHSGQHGEYALLSKIRGVDHDTLYAAPVSWLKDADMWQVVEP